MSSQQFYLLGEAASSARHLELDPKLDLDELKHLVAAHFAIVEPKGRCRPAFLFFLIFFYGRFVFPIKKRC